MIFYGILMTVMFVGTLWKKQEFSEQVDLENIGLNKMKQFCYYKYFKNLEYVNRYHKPLTSSSIGSSLQEKAHTGKYQLQSEMVQNNPNNTMVMLEQQVSPKKHNTILRTLLILTFFFF